MRQIPITDLFELLERYNGMAPMKVAGEEHGPIARDPLNSDDPLIRAAAEELAAKACASRAA
jgi:hypothetical protein